MNESRDNRSEQIVEKTGELMAERRKRGSRTILLAALAVLVVVGAAVAFLSRGGGGGSEYDQKVALGEKYFAEGNYAQAEVTFLEAVGMNERAPRARRGLAYTYAVQGKYEEAKAIYDALYEETGDDIYQSASVATGERRLPVGLELVPIPPELVELNKTAFGELAGTYRMPLPEGTYWPDPNYDEYTIYEVHPELSGVSLSLNADGTFAVTADQYEWFVQGVVADGDILFREEAQGQFLCTGRNDDGAYVLRLVGFADTGAFQDDDYGEEYLFTAPEGYEYYVIKVTKPYNAEHGFTGADEFLLSDGTLVNVAGGQTFTAVQ